MSHPFLIVNSNAKFICACVTNSNKSILFQSLLITVTVISSEYKQHKAAIFTKPQKGELRDAWHFLTLAHSHAAFLSYQSEFLAYFCPVC